jgi:hypothetical protein
LTRRYLAPSLAVVVALAGATLSGSAFAAAPAAKPVIEKLAYAPIAHSSTATDPQAHFTLTIDLPRKKIGNVQLYITQPGGDDYSVAIRGTATGLRHVEVKADALSVGKYRLFLADRLYGVGAPTLESKPVVLTIDAAGDGKVS